MNETAPGDNVVTRFFSGIPVSYLSETPFGNANHFQVHLGAGLQVAITEHIFVRPQFDYRYVPGLTDQFGSNNVPAFTVWLGYHWGGTN